MSLIVALETLLEPVGEPFSIRIAKGAAAFAGIEKFSTTFTGEPGLRVNLCGPYTVNVSVDCEGEAVEIGGGALFSRSARTLNGVTNDQDSARINNPLRKKREPTAT